MYVVKITKVCVFEIGIIRIDVYIAYTMSMFEFGFYACSLLCVFTVSNLSNRMFIDSYHEMNFPFIYHLMIHYTTII